jgi:hypothetical protein
MQIQAAVAKHAVSRIMPILTQLRIIIKPAAHPYIGWRTQRPKVTFVLAIRHDLFVGCVVCVAIQPAIDSGVQTALFDLLSDLDVLDELCACVVVFVSVDQVLEDCGVLVYGDGVAAFVV